MRLICFQYELKYFILVTILKFFYETILDIVLYFLQELQVHARELTVNHFKNSCKYGTRIQELGDVLRWIGLHKGNVV